jgi:amino acid transporter
MDFAEILEALKNAVEDKNMLVLAIIMIAVMVLFVCNIILGTIEGSKKENFNLKKFLFGILKAVVLCFVTLLSCYGFNLLCIGLKMADFVSISAEVIAGAQIVAVAGVYGIDLGKEVIEKIKSFRDLKYTSYDDIKPVLPEYNEEVLDG